MNIFSVSQEMRDEAYEYMAARSKPGPILILSFFFVFVYISPIYQDNPDATFILGICLIATTLIRIINEFGFSTFFYAYKKQWIIVYNLSISLNALIWGFFCLVVVAEYGINWISLLLLVCTAGISAGGIIAVIPHQLLSITFQALILLPTALYSFTLNNLHAYSISYMFLTYLVFMSIMGHKLHNEYWVAVKNVRLLDDRAKELEESRDKAIKLANVKSEFLATMSHELRTPMNGILGMAQLMEMTQLDQDQKDYVATITKSSNSLLNIINDILDFSKMDSGNLQLDLHGFNLTVLASDVVQLLQPTAESKNISLTLAISDDCAVDLIGDSGRIRQILINLIGNAIKFTEEGSVSIDISSKLIDEEVNIRFNIIDTGVGINLSQQSQIFSAFTQADASTTRKFGGTGLGLAICKQLISSMDGQIGVQSILDRGSTFWFELPLVSIFTEESTQQNQNFTLKLLLIDSSMDDVKYACTLLSQMGYSIDMAFDHTEAIELVNNTLYDLIFIDCSILCDQNDLILTTLQSFSMDNKRQIPIVGTIKETSDIECFNNFDIKKFLEKPFDSSVLQKTIGELTVVKNVAKNSPGTSSSTSTSILNRKTLDNLKIAMEDDYGQLIETQIDSIRNTIANIRQSFNENDIHGILSYIQSLKSCSESIGATTLLNQTTLLEKNIAEQNQILSEDQLNELNQSLNSTIEALQVELKV